MNTAELADRVAQAHGLNKTQAKAMIDTVLKAITEAAATGTEVSLPGFGKFKVQNRPEREARNPRTGEMISVAASRKLIFQPAKAVRDALNT